MRVVVRLVVVRLNVNILMCLLLTVFDLIVYKLVYECMHAYSTQKSIHSFMQTINLNGLS